MKRVELRAVSVLDVESLWKKEEGLGSEHHGLGYPTPSPVFCKNVIRWGLGGCAKDLILKEIAVSSHGSAGDRREGQV
jgi:hypothetical protein